MKGFFDYADGNTLIHKLDPLTKIFVAISICIACFISSNHFFLIALIALNLAIAISAGVGKRAWGILKGLLKISIFIFILQLLFIRGETVWIKLPFGLDISLESILKSLLIVLRLIGATMPLAIMLSVTQMNDLSNVLVTKLHIPYKYAFSLVTAIRFIPVFSDEMTGIMEAQTARGVEFDTKNPFKKLKLILPLCVPLLISSVKKSDNSAISAELRGFDLRTKNSCYKKYPITYIDIIFIISSVILITSAVVLNLYVN